MANTATMSSLYVAVLVCFQIALVVAAGQSKLKCVDDKKGMCSTNWMTGFCFYDVLNSTFDCDKENYCAKQPSLLVKRTSGCFDKRDTGEEHKCCCNTRDMCAFGLLQQHGNKSLIQRCYNMYKMGTSDQITSRTYTDRYCVSILIAQSRYPKKKEGEYHNSQFAMHYFYDMDVAAGGQSDRAKLVKPFHHVRCSNMHYTPVGQGADKFYQGCTRVKYKMYNGKIYRGTFCCCYGKAECNKGVTLSSVNVMGYKAQEAGGAAEVASLLGFYSLLFVTLLPLINQISPIGML